MWRNRSTMKKLKFWVKIMDDFEIDAGVDLEYHDLGVCWVTLRLVMGVWFVLRWSLICFGVVQAIRSFTGDPGCFLRSLGWTWWLYWVIIEDFGYDAMWLWEWSWVFLMLVLNSHVWILGWCQRYYLIWA